MHPRRHALLRATAGAVGAVLLVGSCSADAGSPQAEDPSPAESPSGSPTGSAAATEEPSPAEPTVPSPPPMPEPPRSGPGPKGQRAFAQHVIASWAWALQANDAEPLVLVSRSPQRLCTGCRDLVRELRKRDRQGWYVDLPAVSVQRTRLRRDGDEVVATSRVDIPESDTYFYDGTFRSTNRAHDDAAFTVRMRKSRDGYVLVSFTLA